MIFKQIYFSPLSFSVLSSAVAGFLCAYAFAHPSIATMRRLNRADDDYGVGEALTQSITGQARRGVLELCLGYTSDCPLIKDMK